MPPHCWVRLNAQRFSLDFMPVPWGVMALGSRHVETRWWKGLVAWSIGLNVFVLALLPEIVHVWRRL